MIPILMQDETTVGFLKESMSCVVTEERNGVFELTLTYPVTGALFDKLQIDRFVKAKPNDTADLQLFRIYEVTKPMNGVVTVNAEHVSYALSNFPVEEIRITGTATQAINEVLSDVTYDLEYFEKVNPFRVATTDMDAVKTFEFKVGSARAALGGTEGSILDVFGGEYEFDNYTIRLHKHRGRDTGIVIAYGKNMTDIKVTTSLESAYTALYPYAVKDDRLYIANVWEFETEPTLTFIEYDPIMPVTNNAGIADRMLIRDFTNEFVKDETVSNLTLAEKAEKWLQKHDINSPSVNVTVSFVQLWESSEYEELKALEQVSLCDWVTIRHKDLGIDMKAQVVKTVYDTIAERYNKIELGSAKANFGDTIRQATDDLTKYPVWRGGRFLRLYNKNEQIRVFYTDIPVFRTKRVFKTKRICYVFGLGILQLFPVSDIIQKEMENLKIAICDDERAVCRQIKDLTETYLQTKGIQGECETFNVYQQLQGRESEFDLFLLDYKMPDVDGLEFARALYEKYGEKKTIVFITAYPEIVYDAFEVRTYRFLIKPIEKEKLFAALDAYLERYRSQYYLSVLSDGRTEVIPLEEILYIEVMRKDCMIVLAGRTVVCKKTIAAFEEELAPFDFYRVHRAYLVNMRKIRSYDSRIIQLDNGEKVFMGPKKYGDFCKAYIKLLK